MKYLVEQTACTSPSHVKPDLEGASMETGSDCHDHVRDYVDECELMQSSCAFCISEEVRTHFLKK